MGESTETIRATDQGNLLRRHMIAIQDIPGLDPSILDERNIQVVTRALEGFGRQNVNPGEVLCVNFSGVRGIAPSAASGLVEFFEDFFRGKYMARRRSFVLARRMRAGQVPIYLCLYGLDSVDTRDPLQVAIERYSPGMVLLAPRADMDAEDEPLQDHTIGAWGTVGRTRPVFALLWRSSEPLQPKGIVSTIIAGKQRNNDAQIRNDLSTLMKLHLIAQLSDGRYYRVR